MLFTEITAVPPTEKRLYIDMTGCRQFPERLYQLTNLEELTFVNLEMDIPAGISALTALYKLLFKGTQGQEIPTQGRWQLPNDVWQLPSLRYLDVCRLPLQELPDGIEKAASLSNITISYCPLLRLPAAMGKTPLLYSVEITHTLLAGIPESLVQSGVLRHLHLSYNQICRLPEDLSGMQKLETFYISDNPLEAVPESITALQNLERLGFGNSKVTQVPALYKIPKLEFLYFRDAPIAQTPMELLWCEQLNSANIAGFSPWFHTYCDKYFKGANAAKVPRAARFDLYSIFTKDKDKTAKLPYIHLLEALRTDEKLFIEPTIEEIEKRYAASAKKLQKGCEVAVLGNIFLKKNELRERLEAWGIAYAIKIKKTTTHVVLGKKIDKIDGAAQEGLVFMSERDLDQFLRQDQEQFLKEAPVTEAPKMQQDVAQMLLHQDAANVEIGLQLLDSGGVPDSLFTELFIVAKNPEFPDKVRKKAKSLLELHAPSIIANKLNLKDKLFERRIDEDRLKYNILHFTKDTILNPKTIATYAQQLYGSAYKVWFYFLPPEERYAEMEQQLADPRYCPNYTYVWSTYIRSGELVPLLPQLRHLNYWYAGLRSFPDILYNCINLETLDLSSNNIQKLDERMLLFNKLQKLNISNNKFSHFPPVLLQMPNLKTILIQGNPFFNAPDFALPDDVFQRVAHGHYVRVDKK